MAQMLYGKPVADALTADTRRRADLLRDKGVMPKLVILRCGENEADGAYIRGAMKRGGLCGVDVELRTLAADVSADTLARTLKAVNGDSAVHGCLLLRPLPGQLKAAESGLCALLDPRKDVDGMTPVSAAGVFTGSGEGFPPCTAQACLEILKYYDIPLSGKRAVVVGRSLVVGKPAAMMLDRENATVTICNSRTQNLPALCKEADVVVVAMGKRGFIGADCLREGQTVVDVGIHVGDDGMLCGDVRFAEAEPVVEAITPVPGGVGTVTTSVLVGHVVEAAEKTLL